MAYKTIPLWVELGLRHLPLHDILASKVAAITLMASPLVVDKVSAEFIMIGHAKQHGDLLNL